jgi:RNA polymerase sigma-70 factor (ECF subfamily)
MDDRKLLEACIMRDAAAWQEFISRFSGLAYAAISNRIKKCGVEPHPHDIEDIRQGVFMSIWEREKLKSVLNACGLPYWIAAVSANAATDYLRKTGTKKSLKTLSFDEMALDEDLCPEILSAAVNDPAAGASAAEVSAKIASAIRRLPPRERLMIKLNLMHGKKYCEISGMLNVPQGTVSSYIMRAKQRLRKYLKGLK